MAPIGVCRQAKVYRLCFTRNQILLCTQSALLIVRIKTHEVLALYHVLRGLGHVLAVRIRTHCLFQDQVICKYQTHQVPALQVHVNDIVKAEEAVLKHVDPALFKLIKEANKITPALEQHLKHQLQKVSAVDWF